jgi:plastocyanin
MTVSTIAGTFPHHRRNAMNRTMLNALVAASTLLAAGARAQVSGRITHAKGTVPPATLKADKDVAVCGKTPIPDETLVVAKDGGLANAVVSIEGVPGAATKPSTATIDQTGCRYQPHVQAVSTGSSLVMGNSDPLLHNVHAYHGDRTVFNAAMPIPNMKLPPKKLDKAGVVNLKCDAGHAWMSAYIVVKPHGFVAVTGADGTFKIEGVPAGSYTAEIWHEKLGTKKVQVTVAADGKATLDAAL